MPNKIVIIAPNFPPYDGGVANFANEIAMALHKSGHLKYVLALNKQDVNYNKNKVTYTVKQSNFYKVLLRYQWQHRRTNKWLRLYNSLILYITILKTTLKELKTLKGQDVIITSCVARDEIFFMLGLLYYGISYKLLVHGLDVIYNTKNHNFIYKLLCKKADGIIVNSNETKALFKQKLGNINSNMSLVYPILNVQELQELKLKSEEILQQDLNISFTGKKVIFAVSRLEKRKGFDILIKTVVKLKAQYPELILIIAGKGHEKQNIDQLILDLDATSYIFTLGFIDDVTKFSLMQLSNYFILPTRSLNGDDFEGFGIVFIEASYYKNIVIGGDHGGVKESVKDGETGYRIDFDTSNGPTLLYKKLNYLFQNADQVEVMSQKGRDFVLNNYSSINIKQLLK